MTGSPGPAVDEILFTAVGLAAEERADYLARACGDDAALRAEVESLLAAHGEDPEFLESPLLVAAEVLGEGDAADDPLLGRRLGRYRLLERLGAGGMGTVYLAERADAAFEKQVAVKLVRPGLDPAETQRRFRTERQLLAQLEHPNIARLIDGGVADDGRPYLVMEQVEGVAVDRYCDDRRLAVRQRIELFLQICDAVGYAHRNLVVHRDLKPSNVLVTGEGTVRLLDFGIAKMLDEDAQPATPGVTELAGRRLTPRYASPEQLRGSPISTASDVYSLGVVLYELVCGRSPYRLRTGTAAEIEAAVCEEPVRRPAAALGAGADEPAEGGRGGAPDPSSGEIGSRRSTTPARLRRFLSGDLETILLAALRKEPGRRYASVEALADDLRRYLDGRPIAARGDSVRYRLSRFVGRHRVAVASAAAMAVLLLVAAATSTVLYLRARAALAEAEIQRSTTEQVSGFLEHMLSRADPVATQSREEIRVRDVLDEAARRIDQELGDQPRVAAELHATVGKAYGNLALYEEAEANLTTALALHRAESAAGEPLVSALVDLGLLHHSAGEYDRAEPLLREAVEAARGLPDEPGARAEAERALGALLRSRGEPAAAADRLRRALELLRASGERVEEGRTRLQLGMVLSDLGEYEEAEQRMLEGLAVLREELGGDHSFVAQGHNDLAWVLGEAEQRERGLPHLQRALDAYSRTFDPQHPKVLIARANLASVLRELGQHDKAVAELQRALDGFTASLGDDHPYVAHTWNNLAAALEARGDFGAAAEHYREAEVRYRRVLGEEHPFVAVALANRGRALHQLGDLDGAERAVETAYSMRRKLLRAGHPDLARSLEQLGELALSRRRLGAAEERLRQALTIRVAELAPDHPLTARTRRLLATCLVERGRADEAERLLRAARQALASGNDPAELARVDELLGRLGSSPPAG